MKMVSQLTNINIHYNNIYSLLIYPWSHKTKSISRIIPRTKSPFTKLSMEIHTNFLTSSSILFGGERKRRGFINIIHITSSMYKLLVTWGKTLRRPWRNMLKDSLRGNGSFCLDVASAAWILVVSLASVISSGFELHRC